MGSKKTSRISTSPTIRTPGVYVEEISSLPRSIAGVSTSTAAFIGPTRKGPTHVPVEIRSLSEYQKTFGARSSATETGHAVHQFFLNGGKHAHVIRVPQRVGLTGIRVALRSLKQLDEVGLLLLPGNSDIAIISHVARHCERHCIFLIVDPPKSANTPAAVQTFVNSLRPGRKTNVAVYFPWINILDPATRKQRAIPPGGAVAGIYAQTDIARGVWKSPANVVVRGTRSLVYNVSAADSEQLNAKGINCIRRFAGRGIRVWGARTISSDPEWKYVNVRRLVFFLERSIQRGTRWAVFEPNEQTLWQKVRQAIENFLITQFRGGAFQGAKQEQAFFVRCDRSTMTQNDIDTGKLIAEIGIAPVKPAEFVIFRIQQKTMGRK